HQRHGHKNHDQRNLPLQCCHVVRAPEKAAILPRLLPDDPTAETFPPSVPCTARRSAAFPHDGMGRRIYSLQSRPVPSGNNRDSRFIPNAQALMAAHRRGDGMHKRYLVPAAFLATALMVEGAIALS